MKMGILREGKVPADSRVPIIPEQCRQIQQRAPVEVAVQPFAGRCFSDKEFLQAGIRLQEDLQDCTLLMGVKEVPVQQLIPGRRIFFSHTIKKQPYNRNLLQAVLEKDIRLIDYEVLTDDEGERLIAFGKFAGMVGAHNALYAYGERTHAFRLRRMKDCRDYAEAKLLYRNMQWPPLKIVLTGMGRVGSGAAEVLRDMGIREVDSASFVKKQFQEAVFTQLRAREYVRHGAGLPFEPRHYYAHPEEYESAFASFAEAADIFINGIFWDNRAPVFFTREMMNHPRFRIRTIADVTCDIAPVSSVPSTIRPSTIAAPVYGYDPYKGKEVAPYLEQGIDVMAIDNLPNEMPRDASAAFGQMFLDRVLPEFFKSHSPVLERATIADKGALCPLFSYLEDYVNERQL
ncbi:MAG: alanine dehydrogenase [Haliscomenobacter sp.]|nr:alanine dehydrogenase [Haliscomenobacter sp.]